MSDDAGAYSEGAFNKKMRALAGLKALTNAARQVHAVLRDPATPVWIKGLCVAVLGYLILPTDAVADFIPVLGYGDDVAALTAALTTIAAHVSKKALAPNSDDSPAP